MLYLILDAQRRFGNIQGLIKIFIQLLCTSDKQDKDIEITIIRL